MGKKRIIKKDEGEASQEAQPAEAKAQVEVSSRSPRQREGRVYIYSSYNNTGMTLADLAGNTLVSTSAGSIGFKGARKATPFAASKVAETIATAAKNKGIERIEILVKGIGSGRESALRSFATRGFEITAIKDITPVPHNGPRPRKVRRV